MSIVAMLVFGFVLVAFVISATLAVVYIKLARTPRSQPCPSEPGLVSSLSMGTLEKYIGFPTLCKPGRRAPVVDVPIICVSTTTSFHSLASMEAINDGSYYPGRTHVCFSNMHESIVHRPLGSRGIRFHRHSQSFVDTVEVAPVGGDATPFDPLDCGSDTFRFPTEGPSEQYLLSFGIKKTNTSEPAPAEVISNIAAVDDEEVTFADADPFHVDAAPFYTYAMSLSSTSYDIHAMMQEIEDEITEYQEADFTSRPSPSSQEPSLSTLMEEDESVEEEDYATPAPRSSTPPNLEEVSPADYFFSQLAYLASPSRASRTPSLITVTEDDESSEDEDPLFDDSTSASSASSTSTTPTFTSPPSPCIHNLCDISSSSSITPLNWPTIVISNSQSFHTLDSLEAICNIDRASDPNYASDHICESDLFHGLLWRPISVPYHARADVIDPTMLNLDWAPQDDYYEYDYDYEAETNDDDNYDKNEFTFLADDDYEGHAYDDYNAYDVHAHHHQRSRCSDPGMLAVIAEEDEDGDARFSDSEAEILDILADDEDGDACLSSSDEESSLSLSTASMSTSPSSSSSCTSIESKFKVPSHSFGIPLARCSSRRGTYPRPLTLVSRLAQT